MLTVVDTKGATAQATANVTVNNLNHPPVVIVQNVTVFAQNTGGTANASIDNGSYDPDGDTITLTQTPAAPYAVGVTSVTLTVTDSFGVSSQGTANVTVDNPGFTFAPTLPSVIITAGGSAIEHITFSPSPGIGSALGFSCTNLPAKSSCSFTPNTVASGSAQTDVVVTLSTMASTASFFGKPRIFYAAWLPMTGLSLIGMAVMPMPRKRRNASAVVRSLLAIFVLTFLAGCGGNSYNGTPKGTYTVTVAGTSGNVTQSTTFTLTIN
jgi:hypothetical protein